MKIKFWQFEYEFDRDDAKIVVPIALLLVAIAVGGITPCSSWALPRSTTSYISSLPSRSKPSKIKCKDEECDVLVARVAKSSCKGIKAISPTSSTPIISAMDVKRRPS
jgi:hypothetical protein